MPTRILNCLSAILILTSCTVAQTPDPLENATIEGTGEKSSYPSDLYAKEHKGSDSKEEKKIDENGNLVRPPN